MPQRKEKNCLNCGAQVQGRYCQDCGQENLEPKENFWHLITHFFYDFTHFDGKFFSTLKYLISRPGFLSTEYMRGRRATYLHPVRMYVFTSAFFFIIFFSVVHVGKINLNLSNISKEDSIAINNARQLALNRLAYRDSIAGTKRMDSASGISSKNEGKKSIPLFSLKDNNYSGLAAYDSAQKILPASKRDNWVERIVTKKMIVLRNTYKERKSAFFSDLINHFLHQFPKLFFISLPIFALILKLLYSRRKQFYYADHGIFTIHLYIFSYVFFLAFFSIQELADWFPSAAWAWLSILLWLYWLYYAYRAMRNFYQQGTGKTLVKYLLLNCFAFLSILILFIIFFFLSVLQM